MKRSYHIVLLIPVIVFAGCRPEWIGPKVDRAAVERGRLVWDAEECSACHGENGEGTTIGPSLSDVAEHWQDESLADFLKDPQGQLEDNPRLKELTSTYDVDMPGVRQADDDEVEDLVVFLLNGIE